MRKLNLLFFAVVGVLMAAMPALAQAPGSGPRRRQQRRTESYRRGSRLCHRRGWRRDWPVAHRRGGL